MATKRAATRAAKAAIKPKAKAKAKAAPKAKAKPKLLKGERPSEAAMRLADVEKAKTKTKPKATAKAKPKPKAKVVPKTKAPAKPKVAKKGEPLKRDVLGQQAVKLRADGLTWKEIAKKLNSDVPQLHLAYQCATVKPSEKITGTREEVAAEVARQRDEENAGWFTLQARTGHSQAMLKKLYTEATGNPANQGFDVMRRQIATRMAAKGAGVKTKKADGTKVAAKAKRTTARTARKKATGSANPSKG